MGNSLFHRSWQHNILHEGMPHVHHCPIRPEFPLTGELPHLAWERDKLRRKKGRISASCQQLRTLVSDCTLVEGWVLVNSLYS